MIKNKNVEKYLWITTVLLITYLFLGDFILDKNIIDLIYLIILYGTMVVIKFKNLEE